MPSSSRAVYDRDSQAQYYYHAHREGDLEHGHFHTFIRAIAQLIAVSMDAWGQPIGLFVGNRWVTGET